ncbi:phage tail spike protein [Lactobacillus taiwanensis]|uniref:phage tail spike protein n=1 Tax=Lactobacillus taiwanensis TaxID=508451 RepID=UPI00321FE511
MIFYLLNKGQQTVKLLNNDETIESNLDEAINTAGELKFSLPLQKRLDSNIYYVLIPEFHGNDFLMFKIISEDVQKDRVEYSAVESAYDELKSYEYIKDIRPHQMNAAQMLQQVLKNTRWSLGYVEDTGIQSTTFYYVTILEAIQKIVDLFKVELTFTIQLDPVTQKITGRRVNLYQQQGRRTGKRFEYGSNLLTVTREEDSQNLVTALVGRGKGVQVSGQDTEDTSDDGYSRRLTFADVEWKTSAGAPVNKPKGQEYVEDPKATALYGFSDGHPRIGLVTFEDIEDPNQLINATWSALLEAKRPKVSFKAEVTDVGNLQLGDTIAIIRHDLGIEYFTRVYKVHHNLKDENRNTVEMGDDFSSRSITSAISNAIQISQDATTIANTAAIAANGKNRNFYSNTKPLFANEGDNLFLNLGNGETEMWVWHHGQWEFVQSTVELHTVQKEVKEAQDVLKDAKKEIADNLAKADKDIAELNASIGNQNSKIEGLNTSVNTVVIPKVTDITNQVSDVVTKVSEQKNIVTGLQNQATQQGKDISKITTDVHGVTVDLANLNGDVNQTKATVQGLQTTLGNAQGDIAQIKVDAKKLSTSLSGKVDNSTYANFVSATNNALNAKLVASDLNGYAKTTDVQATANGLQVNINSLSGKLDNLVIGNRNLVRNSGFPKNTDYWSGPEIANHDFYYSKTKPLFLLKNSSSEENYAESNYFPLKRNTTYVVSFKGFSSANVSSYDVFILSRKYGETNKYSSINHVIDAKRLSPSKVDYIKDLTFNSGENDEAYIRFDNNGSTNNETGWLFFTEVKVEEGNKSTAWTPAPEDEQERVNSITSQLSARITANSQQFSSYYSKTDVDHKVSGVQSQITQNATGLQSVVAKVDNIRIGGTNLIRNSNFDTNLHGFWQTNGNYVVNWKSPGVEIPKGDLIQNIPAKPNTTYTFSFDLIYQDVTDKGNNQFFFVEYKDSNCTKTTNTYEDHRFSGNNFPNTAGRKDKKLTFTTQSDCYGLKMYIRQDSSKNKPFHIAKPKLEEGNQATDWSPSPEDKANQSDYSALNQTVKGLQSTVSSNYGNLQSQISQTAGTIRNEITNKVSGVQSQITQNVNNLNLRINNTSRNLVLNSGNFQNLHGWYTNSNGSLTLGKHSFWKNSTENVLWINNPSKTNEVIVSSARFYVQPHTTYTISFYAFASVNVRNSDLYFLGRKRNSNKDFEYIIQPINLRRYSPSHAEYVTVTINTGESEEGYLRFDNNGSTDGNSNLLGITDIQMEEGSVATPWKPAINDQVLAQINVAAGNTLIQNDKIYMDASSTVFSGKAFIPNAAITNISADKINTGTLDAGRINVINLNANNITTGTINGANLKINLNSGEILFQKGRIASTNGNLNIDLNNGTMSVTNYWGMGVFFQDGQMILDDRNSLGLAGSYSDANPKYGIIKRSYDIFSEGVYGMDLLSPNAVSIKTTNYDGIINTGTGLDSTKNGAVMTVTKYGNATINSANTTYLTGGLKFNQSKVMVGERPHIWIGTFNSKVGDRIEIDANYVHMPTTYWRTTGAAPNLHIADDGALVRSTSASKYKTNIQRSYSTEYGDKLLNLPTAIWTDKGQKERYEAGKRHIKPEKYFGMIAEDLADAGLDLLVSRNPETHEIEGIQYERIAPALLPVIKKLKDKVNRLEKQINE